MIPIKLRSSLVLVALLLLSACGALGLSKPATIDQRLAYAEGQVTAAYETIANLATRKRISAETGAKLIADVDSASASLKTARIFLGSDQPASAETALAAAVKILTDVETKMKGAQ